MSNPTKIVLNRQSDLILDNALITNPQGIVLTDISGVSEAVASINTSTSTDISVETSSRVAADASLQNQIDFITNNADPAAIDSLVEVVVAFQSADGDLNGAITNLANAATTDLSAETSRAISAEESLSAAKLDLAGGTMSGNIDMDSNEINNLNAVRTDELSNRAGTSGLGFDGNNIAFGSGRFTYLQAPVDGGDAANKDYVDGEISAEISARISGDLSVEDFVNTVNSGLVSALSTEVSRAESSEVSIATIIGSFNPWINILPAFNYPTFSNLFNGNFAVLENNYDFFIRHQIGIDFYNSGIIQQWLQTTGQPNDTSLTVEEREIRDILFGYFNNAISELSNLSNQFANAGYTNGMEIALLPNIHSSFEMIQTEANQFADKLFAIKNKYALLSLETELSADISTNVSVEASDRIAGDLSLQSQIDFITNNADPAAIDSLTEVVAAFQSADGDINNAITNLANAATTDLSAEISRAQSVEATKLDLAGGTMSGNINMGGTASIQGADFVSADRISTNNLDGFGSDITVDNGLDFGGNNLPKNLSAPTNGGDATNKDYVDTKLPLAGGTMTGTLTMDEGQDIILGNNDFILNSQGGGEIILGNSADLVGKTGTNLRVTTDADFYLISGFGNELVEKAIVYLQNDNLQIKQSDENGGNVRAINIDSNNDGIFITDDRHLMGMQYKADYSANYTNRSLVDKEYVDGVSSTISTELSASVSDRVVADESLAATISTEIESLALTDESTIELNTADNTIRLKETVSAPDSGVRTFLGEVDVETVLKVAGVDVMATLSSEVSRAESAEASIAEELSSEVSYIMANTDLSSIDSFAEVVADLSSEVSRAESVELSLATDFANIYAKKVAVTETPNGSTTTFTLANSVREGSELVYLNGLSLDSEDYTANITNGLVTSITFTTAPSTGDKVKAYGVY